MRHAELAAPFFLGVVDVDADDHVSARHARALDHVEADTAKAENNDIFTHLNLGRVDDRADTGGDAAADIAGFVKRRVFTDLRDGDFRQDGEVREGGTAHIVEDGLAFIAEAAGAVGHQALALSGANGRTQIGLARKAAFALAAFGRVERDDVIAGLHAGHACAHLADDAGAFMAEHAGEDAFTVEPVEGVGVGMADAGRHDFHQHFASLGTFKVKLDNLERFLGFKGNGGACFHGGGS